MAIIKSLLDSDWYKITMMYAAFKTLQRLGMQMPITVYRFKCRNAKDLTIYEKEVRAEIEFFMKLKFTDNDIAWIMKRGLFDPSFGPFLKSINLRDVSTAIYERDGKLEIEVEGPWIPAILFEVPVLSIVNEVYFKGRGDKKIAEKNLTNFLNNVPKFYEFGTRRRRSASWQKHVVEKGIKAGKIYGTSNALIAKENGMEPIGSMAHEWLQAFQVISRDLRNFQTDALEHWMLTYRGKLATALTDVIGIDAFLNDLDPLLANNFTALRWDSGCPFQFIDKVKKKYLELKIGLPIMWFSDGLDDKRAQEIQRYANNAGVGLFTYPCIGTFATNNWGDEALQIVMKMVKMNGQEVIKLPDTPGKRMNSDSNAVYRLIETFNLKGYK